MINSIAKIDLLEEPNAFPKLMIIHSSHNHSNGTIVLFEKSKVGMVIDTSLVASESPTHDVAYSSSAWAMSHFIDFKGVIQLS